MDPEKRLNLLLICLIQLCSAVCLTLLVPFYSKEARARGITVTQSGQVIGSIYIVNIVLTPLVARYISVVGARKLILAGCFICAVGNIGTSLLDTVFSSKEFFVLSLLGRVVVGAGDSAISATAYTLAGQQAGEKDQGKVLGLTEASFGVGTMLGPCLGGFLYQRWGFAIPFLVSGLVLLSIGTVSCFFLTDLSGTKNKETSSKSLTWTHILLSEGVLVSMLMVVLASSAYSWYSTTLEPFLSKSYGLSAGQTGLVLMVNALLYTSFTPVFGWLTDHCRLDGLDTQILGNMLIAGSFLFIAPVPPLQAVGGQVWITVVAVGIQGLGSAALYLGSLLYMMRAVRGQGEQSQGMVSSLWAMSEWAGAYAGATLGSWAYDMVGFAMGTMMEGVVVALGTIMVLIFTIKRKCRRKKTTDGSYSDIFYKPIVLPIL